MPRSILTPFTFSTGGNTITSHGAAIIPLAIRGSSTTPTSDLLSIQTNGGTPLSGFDSAANLFVNKTSYGTSIVSSGPANVTFWKIATLPATSAGTFDHLVLDVVLDDNWGSAQKVTAKILFSNRDAFTFRYYLNGTVRSAARVLAYTESNGTVSIYLRAGNGNFCTFSYNITHGVDANLSIPKNPASTTTTPTGTLAFDSSNIGTYVPESYIPYTGQPIIRGLVNSSGTVSGASFVRSGGTTNQFLKANGDVDSNTYLPTTSSYFAGHNPEGRLMYNTYLTNDMANARLRGSAVAATQNGSAYTISNANWDAMFDGTATFFNISPTSGFTFPLVITVPLPRTLTYGTWIGLSFGSTTFRANSVTIEVFSLDSSSWVTVFTTTTNTSEDIFTSVSGLTNSNATGINQVRYTISSPNSTQLRLQHLWAYNFNSDMWSQTMMPRAGGTMYGALTVPDRITLKAVANAANQSNGLLLSNAVDAWQSGVYLRTDGSGNPRLSLLAPTGALGEAVSVDSAAKVGIGNVAPVAQLDVYSQAAARVGQVIRGATSQTADILQIQSSAGTVLGGHNRIGQLFTGTTTPILSSTGGIIQSIATGANPLVTMASAHGLTTGDLVTLASTTGGTYNGTFVVASTPLTTTFTITTALTTGQAGTGGIVTSPVQASITARSASTTGLIVRGAASQIASVQEWQNSSGTVTGYVRPDGNAIIFGGVEATYYMTTTAGTTSNVPMTVYGQASHTSNLQEWRRLTEGTPRAFITPTGNMVYHVDTNPRTANYTLALVDDGDVVEMNVASANTVTIPLNSSVAFPIGTQITVIQTGTGQTSIAVTSGVTLNATPVTGTNNAKLRAQWSSLTLLKRGTDTWIAMGDLTA